LIFLVLGRVYILKWRSNARKLFFWMQEPKEDKDEEWCKKINELVKPNFQAKINSFFLLFS
jgi:hypothetical protein